MASDAPESPASTFGPPLLLAPDPEDAEVEPEADPELPLEPLSAPPLLELLVPEPPPEPLLAVDSPVPDGPPLLGGELLHAAVPYGTAPARATKDSHLEGILATVFTAYTPSHTSARIVAKIARASSRVGIPRVHR